MAHDKAEIARHLVLGVISGEDPSDVPLDILIYLFGFVELCSRLAAWKDEEGLEDHLPLHNDVGLVLESVLVLGDGYVELVVILLLDNIGLPGQSVSWLLVLEFVRFGNFRRLGFLLARMRLGLFSLGWKWGFDRNLGFIVSWFLPAGSWSSQLTSQSGFFASWFCQLVIGLTEEVLSTTV